MRKWNIAVFLVTNILLMALQVTDVIASSEVAMPQAVTTETPTPEAVTTETPTPEAVTTETPTPEAVTTETPTPEAVTTETPTPEATLTPTIISEDISIVLDKSKETLVKGGSTVLKATIYPSYANQAITWLSSDNSVAVVDSTGKVTAIKVGKTLISAITSVGNQIAKCEITVNDILYDYPNTMTNADNGDDMLTANAYEFDVSAYVGTKITVDIQSLLAKDGGNFSSFKMFRWDTNGDISNYNPVGSVNIGNLTITSTDPLDEEVFYTTSFTYTPMLQNLLIVLGYYQKSPYEASEFATTLSLDINGSTTSPVDFGIGKTFGNYFETNFFGIGDEGSFENEWIGKESGFMGDSITYGLNPDWRIEEDRLAVRFPELAADTLEMEYTNYGVIGSTIAVNPYAPSERNPMVERYSDISETADLIVIAGGSNDWQYNWSPIGDMDSRDDTTFYGALHNLYSGLLDSYPDAQIVVLTPIKRAQSPYGVEGITNAYGLTLEEYGDIIKEVCSYYEIPVLDGYNGIAINPYVESQKSLLIPDGVHPNENGHELIAERLIEFLMSL